MSIKMSTLELFNIIPQDEAEDLRIELASNDFAVFSLDGLKVQNMNDMLKHSAIALPQPESTSPPRSYSVLSDNLWQGFSNLDQTKVAVIWNRADVLLSQNLKDFLQLVDLFTVLSRQLNTQERAITVFLILAGEGKNF